MFVIDGSSGMVTQSNNNNELPAPNLNNPAWAPLPHVQPTSLQDIQKQQPKTTTPPVRATNTMKALWDLEFGNASETNSSTTSQTTQKQDQETTKNKPEEPSSHHDDGPQKQQKQKQPKKAKQEPENAFEVVHDVDDSQQEWQTKQSKKTKQKNQPAQQPASPTSTQPKQQKPSPKPSPLSSSTPSSNNPPSSPEAVQAKTHQLLVDAQSKLQKRDKTNTTGGNSAPWVGPGAPPTAATLTENTQSFLDIQSV